ncbi:MAG: ParB/RepB/Spo0J family partition protein [Proteobacteria bacterium]|nr:ParB/RepB/Spo0J family partition protein [Pseudomonadota bacterium]
MEKTEAKMSLKDTLKAKTAGLRAKSDEELAIMANQEKRQSRPKTGIGQASEFQLRVAEKNERIAQLESRLAQAGSMMVAIDSISANPWQPRRVFEDGEILKLASSIREVGLIQPIIVRKCVPSGYTSQSVPPGSTFQLVAGERRLRAHKLLEMREIKAVVVEVPDQDMAAMALAENIDREDLSDYEISIAIVRAEADFPNRTAFAEALGMTRSELYRYLAFDKLPAFVIADLEQVPRLLTRHSAIALKDTLAGHGEPALQALIDLWPQVKAGDIPHPKLADAIKNHVARGKATRSERDIKKLFVGKEQAGSITRDATALTVKIRMAALSKTKENRLREFVQKLLVEPD